VHVGDRHGGTQRVRSSAGDRRHFNNSACKSRPAARTSRYRLLSLLPLPLPLAALLQRRHAGVARVACRVPSCHILPIAKAATKLIILLLC
jgi:hypothetical protein